MPPVFLSLLLNRFVIGALAVAILVGGAYFKGYSAASAKCRDAQLQAQIDSMRRDLEAQKSADAIEQAEQARLTAERDKLKKKVNDYEAELAKRPDGRCSLSPDDIRALNRLRAISK